MTRLTFIAAVLGPLLAAPSVGCGQADAPLAPGARMRVEWMETSRRHRAVGRVLALRGDSLTLATPAGVRTFALERLGRIDVRIPRSRARGAARGAGLGALAGLGVGLSVGAYGATHCRASDMCGYGWVVGSAIGGPMIGLALGAIVGGGAPGERWRRVRRER